MYVDMEYKQTNCHTRNAWDNIIMYVWSCFFFSFFFIYSAMRIFHLSSNQPTSISYTYSYICCISIYYSLICMICMIYVISDRGCLKHVIHLCVSHIHRSSFKRYMLLCIWWKKIVRKCVCWTTTNNKYHIYTIFINSYILVVQT